jgi:predicted RNase H-like HicB family nuclease
MATIKLPVLLTPGEDGYIVARIPVIPGCISQGKTREEALANIQEAALLCLDGREEEGWYLPSEFTLEEVELAV